LTCLSTESLRVNLLGHTGHLSGPFFVFDLINCWEAREVLVVLRDCSEPERSVYTPFCFEELRVETMAVRGGLGSWRKGWGDGVWDRGRCREG
jgi:hypothetical protein